MATSFMVFSLSRVCRSRGRRESRILRGPPQGGGRGDESCDRRSGLRSSPRSRGLTHGYCATALRVTHRPSRNSDCSYGPCGPAWTGRPGRPRRLTGRRASHAVPAAAGDPFGGLVMITRPTPRRARTRTHAPVMPSPCSCSLAAAARRPSAGVLTCRGWAGQAGRPPEPRHRSPTTCPQTHQDRSTGRADRPLLTPTAASRWSRRRRATADPRWAPLVRRPALPKQD